MLITKQFVDLRLRETFRISREAREVQPSLLLGLGQEGQWGWGEATLTKYYGITRERVEAALSSVEKMIAGHELQNPESLWHLLHPLLKTEPFVLCALDEAAHDLWGKIQNKSLRELWGLASDKNLPATSYTLGIDSIPQMIAKLEARPWPLYKVKLGTPDDLAIIKALRAHTDAPFRVDANCGWTVKEAIDYSTRFRDLGVEFIEQPLPPEDREGMKEVFQHSALPIMADESCQRETDVDACANHFHGINIKLTKCGGLTPARRMIARARELGLEVMIGCMTESSVGVSAAAQLLPLVDYADLDGPLLIANDPGEGVHFNADGMAIFPDRPGTGVIVN